MTKQRAKQIIAELKRCNKNKFWKAMPMTANDKRLISEAKQILKA